MEKLLYLTLFAPLVGSIFAGILGGYKKNILAAIVPSALLFAGTIAALIQLGAVVDGQVISATLFEWIASGNFRVDFGFTVDQISVVMMCVVTIVSTLVHIYSIGYMSHDEGFNRFFSYLSLFVFSMLVLVMSDNFLGLFIGWEGVGLCSWLLIGFWYKKPFATWAANEAFIMNRVADLGMLVGLFILFWQTGSLKYSEVFAAVKGIDHTVLSIAAVFLFIGAMGKSAQFPFHTWLADAMEGPTPVSALIHAATMVTAGVYLMVRSHELFALTPEVSFFVACLGSFVAAFAATMGLVNRDLKRIIAYSTLSQLGYMFVAAGLGAYWVALFHLMTHAFFKALLFLGAGNVMHAMHDELDIKKMGGLYKPMRGTAIMMILASVALAGIYPFAGFFSKDKILEVAFGTHHYILWATLLITAVLTAFYSFRLIMLVFFGKENYKEHFPSLHPHEAYWYMLAAMAPLAILAVIAGFFEHSLTTLLEKIMPILHPHMSTDTVMALIAVTTVAVVCSIAFTVYKYNKGGFSKELENSFFYKLFYNQYYIPEFYNKFLVAPYTKLSEFAWKKIDLKIIDFVVDTIALVIYKSGERSRHIQSGNLSSMLRWMVFGLLILIIFAALYSPIK
ncbi:MAG: NADH-quinone oxidoreductase subunit L [Campylobacteraceae bacterium]|jgi:NADH-quinone oxidoreductase subunit L|nr:NADH-quinone oxidoreductase subunit L [Campylobacteraceae bacterium]